MTDHDANHFPTIGSLAERAETSQDLENGDDKEKDRPTEEIESLCMKCGEQGTTRLLLTSIPYFREVIVMSFHCDHCGTHNNEVQSAGTIRCTCVHRPSFLDTDPPDTVAEGVIYTSSITNRADLNRQIVRASTCTVMIPEFALTLPPTSRGQLTTVEGLLREIVGDLSTDQPLRRIQDEDSWKKIEELLDRLRAVVGDEWEEGDVDKSLIETAFPPFTITLDDPAGSSFLEFMRNVSDPKWQMRTYERTKQDESNLGITAEGGEGRNWREEDEVGQGGEALDEEVYIFPGVCSSCGAPLETKMKKISVPYFKVSVRSVLCLYFVANGLTLCRTS